MYIMYINVYYVYSTFVELYNCYLKSLSSVEMISNVINISITPLFSVTINESLNILDIIYYVFNSILFHIEIFIVIVFSFHLQL